MIDLLGKLVDAGQYTTVTIIFITILLVIAAGLFIIYKLFSRVHLKNIKGKIAGQEIELTADGEKASPFTSASVVIKSTDMLTFNSVVQQIIDYSVENGNQASLKRQQLYDSQMRYIKDRFDGLTTAILFEYSHSVSKASYILDVIWNLSLHNTIINKLENICRADKLVERSKDKLIEEHRSLIENSYPSLVMDLKKYLTKDTNDSNGISLSFIDEGLLETLDRHKIDISAAITDCLEHSWEEANSYFEELKELRKQLSNNVTNALKSYLPSDQHSMLPTEWYDYDKLPPNEIVGSKI